MSNVKNPFIILAEGIVSKYMLEMNLYRVHEHRMKALKECTEELKAVKNMAKELMGESVDLESEFNNVYKKIS